MLLGQVKSSFISDMRINNDIKAQFSIKEISIEIETTTAVIKNELKYFPMSESNTCIAVVQQRTSLVSFCYKFKN